jgi:hypothetical protein
MNHLRRIQYHRNILVLRNFRLPNNAVAVTTVKIAIQPAVRDVRTGHVMLLGNVQKPAALMIGKAKIAQHQNVSVILDAPKVVHVSLQTTAYVANLVHKPLV